MNLEISISIASAVLTALSACATYRATVSAKPPTGRKTEPVSVHALRTYTRNGKLTLEFEFKTHSSSRHPDRPTKPGKVKGAATGPLARAAGLLLPTAHQSRYTEEFRSELWEIARSGAGWVSLLLYVVRQVIRSVPTGIALRRPHRRSAAP